MQLQKNERVSGDDLAVILEGNTGSFACQISSGQGGSGSTVSLIATADSNHSITSLRLATGNEQWQVRKISDFDVNTEYENDQSQPGQQQQQRRVAGQSGSSR